MRPFPRTARPRLAAAIAACSLAIGALVVPLAHADEKDLKDRRKQAQHQVHSAQHQLDESSSQLRRAQGALDRARAELSDARDDYRAASARLDAAEIRDQEMQERLDAAEQRLQDAQVRLSEGQAALADQRLQLTATVTDIYEQGDPDLLAFASLLESRSTADLTRQAEVNNVIVGRQARAYDDLHAAEVLLTVRENEVQDAKDQVAVERKAAAAHLVTMEALHRETREAKNKVHSLVETRRAARAKAVSAKHHDLRSLRHAKQRENRIKHRLLALARRSHGGGYHGRTGGLMIPPVTGPVTSPFGYREHPIYHYWGLHDGVDFGGGCGTPLKAAAPGRVVASYWSDVYGHRLVIDHGVIAGRGIATIYNHASSYTVSVGDQVAEGQVLGYEGDTGWSTGCHLHFTVMANGQAVDPMNWF